MGINQKLQDLLANFDFFSVQPNLNVFRKQKYSTYLGTFVTFCVGGVTMAYLVLLIEELVSKSLPTIIQSDKQVVETAEFPLLMNNFTLAVSIADMNYDPMKTINQYFTVTVQNCIRIRSLNSTTSKIDVKNVCTTYPTEACDSDDFVTDVQKQYFSKIRLGAVQCLKKDIWESNPPKLQGIVSGNSYAYITIKFSACKNTTEIQTCAPYEDIKSGLNKGYYVVHMSDTLLQMNSPGAISQDIIKLQYTTFSNTSSITIFQGFRIIESLTDIGLITNDVKNDYKLIQQTYREQFSLYNDEYLIYHMIILDDKYTQLSRSYIKFQSILSKIGGLWQMLFLTVAVVLKPFIETEMYVKICNEIFRFEKEEKETQIQESNKVKSNLLQMLSQLNPKFETNIMEIVFLTLGCSRKKKNHLEQAKLQFFDMIDVINLANKSFQLEKLKLILLTDDQRRLFEFIPRPTIYIGSQHYFADLLISSGRLNDALISSKVLKEDEKCNLACKSYYKLVQFPLEQNKLDKRILSYLDSNIIQLFQQLIYSKSISKEQFSLDFANKRSQSEDQKERVDSQGCFSPISKEAPAARVLFIQKK